MDRARGPRLESPGCACLLQCSIRGRDGRDRLRRGAGRPVRERGSSGADCSGDPADGRVRFLILTQYFPPEVGAPQVRLAAVARELGRLGHEVEVVTAMPNYPTGRVRPEYRRSFYRKGVWEGHTVHRVWLWPSVGTGVSRLVNYLSFALTSGIAMA